MKKKWIKRITITVIAVVLITALGVGIWLWDWYKGVGEDIEKREQYYDSLRASGINPDSPMIFTEDGKYIQLDSNDIKKMKGKEDKDSVKNNDKKSLK